MDIIQNCGRQVVSDDVLIHQFNVYHNYDEKGNPLFYATYRFPDHFLETYKKKINWDMMSFYGFLSEEQMEKYADYLNWAYICRIQKMSFDFILKHLNRFPKNELDNILEHNHHINKNEWKEKYMDVVIKMFL